MFGEMAQAIRKAAGLTQAELGGRWEKSRIQVGRYERAGGELPPLIADAYRGIELQLTGSGGAMKAICFPGFHKIPSRVEYGVLIDHDEVMPVAHIVVVQGGAGSGTSLINTDEGRDNLLNRILSADLAGIRLDLIRFTVIYVGKDCCSGTSFGIHLDVGDYCAKGNPHTVNVTQGVLVRILGREEDKSVTISSNDVVAGCAKVYTVFEDRIHLNDASAKALLTKVRFA